MRLFSESNVMYPVIAMISKTDKMFSNWGRPTLENGTFFSPDFLNLLAVLSPETYPTPFIYRMNQTGMDLSNADANCFHSRGYLP